MIKFEKSDCCCMICNTKEKIEKMSIVRNCDNILISFSICEECCSKLEHELNTHNKEIEEKVEEKDIMRIKKGLLKKAAEALNLFCLQTNCTTCEIREICDKADKNLSLGEGLKKVLEDMEEK